MWKSIIQVIKYEGMWLKLMVISLSGEVSSMWVSHVSLEVGKKSIVYNCFEGTLRIDRKKMVIRKEDN